MGFSIGKGIPIETMAGFLEFATHFAPPKKWVWISNYCFYAWLNGDRKYLMLGHNIHTCILFHWLAQKQSPQSDAATARQITRNISLCRYNRSLTDCRMDAYVQTMVDLRHFSCIATKESVCTHAYIYTHIQLAWCIPLQLASLSSYPLVRSFVHSLHLVCTSFSSHTLRCMSVSMSKRMVWRRNRARAVAVVSKRCLRTFVCVYFKNTLGHMPELLCYRRSYVCRCVKGFFFVFVFLKCLFLCIGFNILLNDVYTNCAFCLCVSFFFVLVAFFQFVPFMHYMRLYKWFPI